jgi:multidrug transporter EmrE-like cation transporter
VISILTVVVSVVFSSFAHVFLSKGASGLSLENEDLLSLGGYVRIFGDQWIVLGVVFHILALVLWVLALNKVEITVAYPFLSLGYVLVSLMAYFWLGESLDLNKIIGMMMIVVGIVFISRGASL